MTMKPEDRADHANWVFAVNHGQTKMGFDDWRDEQYLEALDEQERRAEVRPAFHHGGKRVRYVE